MVEPGPLVTLRDRNKSKRRTAVLTSALALFAEQGYDATTVTQIAERAEVAPRTVYGYFPSKIEMATAVPDLVAAGLTEVLRSDPEQPYLDAIAQWLDFSAGHFDLALIELSQRATAANPALTGLSSATLDEALHEGTSRLARQLRRDGDDPVLAVASASIGGALMACIHAVATGAPTEPLRGQVLSVLAAVLASAQAPAGDRAR